MSSQFEYPDDQEVFERVIAHFRQLSVDHWEARIARYAEEAKEAKQQEQFATNSTEENPIVSVARNPRSTRRPRRVASK